MSSVEELLRSMTLEEKAGQMFMIAIPGSKVTEETITLLKKIHPGGIYLCGDNLVNPPQAASFTNKLQRIAVESSPHIPLLLAGDHEGSWALLPSYLTIGPGNMALGATSSEDAAYAIFRIYAIELKAIGLNMDLAPVVDLITHPSNQIISNRSFGEDPYMTSRLGSAAVKGLQENGLIATAKHFPGHGSTSIDSHKELPIIKKSLEELEQFELKPFYAAIKSGVEAIMAAHILCPKLDPEHPASLSSKILDKLLRNKMGFRGVIITDSLNMGAITKAYGKTECVIQAIRAGADMVLLALEKYYTVENLTNEYESRLKALVNAVRKREISMQKIDNSVSRILRLKMKYGITDNYIVNVRKVNAIIQNQTHKELELEIARESITIIKNTDKIIPLKVNKEKTLLVISPISLQKLNLLKKEYTRGIGPNVEPGEIFKFLVEEIKKYHKNVLSERISKDVPGFEEKVRNLALKYKLVIFCTERYPLPGLEFEDEEQSNVINEFLKRGCCCIVIGFRDPYELLKFPEVHGYIATYGFRNCNARAAVEVLFGKRKPKGRLPISIRGLYKRGYAILPLN